MKCLNRLHVCLVALQPWRKGRCASVGFTCPACGQQGRPLTVLCCPLRRFIVDSMKDGGWTHAGFCRGSMVCSYTFLAREQGNSNTGDGEWKSMK